MAAPRQRTGGERETRARHRSLSRRLLLLALVPLLTAGLVAAATLGGVNARRLGAGATVVASCDSNGVTASFTHGTGGTSPITSVTVSGLADPGCEGAQVSVAVANSAGTSIGAGGPVTVATDAGTADNSVTVTLTPNPAAADVTSVHVAVNGP